MAAEEGDKVDRRVIGHALEADGADMVYRHRGSRDELLLGLPDAIGWAVGAGGRWRSMASGFMTVIEVSG